MYRNSLTRAHIPLSTDKCMTGTARYASLNSHYGRELSRRDDMESMAYVLVYFMRGQLPWMGLKSATKRQWYEKVREMKNCMPVEEICQVRVWFYCRRFNCLIFIYKILMPMVYSHYRVCQASLDSFSSTRGSCASTRAQITIT